MSPFEKICNDILKKIHAKGWNVYDQTHIEDIGFEGVIGKYLVTSLQPDIPYLLCPKAENPEDPHLVLQAMENVGKRIRKQPTIFVENEDQPFQGFSLLEQEVKIHTRWGTWIRYPDFITALDTIFDTTK